MDNNYLLGIDIGSTNTKGVIVNMAGNIISCHTVKNKIKQPEINWAEQNPQEWWENCLIIIKTCLQKENINSQNIKGISIGGMVPNLCTLDQYGNSIRPAILYRDNRTLKECKYLNKKFSLNFNLQDMLPKWYWLKVNEFNNYSKIKMILNTHSYLIYKLTGKYSIDCDTAHLFGEILDHKNLTWKKELVKEIGLNYDVLPPIYKPTDIVGKVTKEISSITGLQAGTPVIAGNGDSFMSLLGTGVVHTNDAMIYLGTAATLITCSKNLVDLASGPAFNSGHIHFLGNVLTGGELLSWYKDKLQINNEKLDFNDLENLANKILPGSNGLIVLPHFEGQRTPKYNPLASGAILGLSTKHTAAHIYKAFIEALGYNLLSSTINQNVSIKRLVVTGGAAKNKLFRQILADIFNLKVEYYPKSDATLGTAYFAGYSLGIFSNFDTLRYNWLSDAEICYPNQKNVEIYKKYFSIYQNINQQIQPIYSSLKQVLISKEI